MFSNQRQQIGRVGGLTSWGRTVDRAERMAPVHRANPSSVDYWLNKLDPELFADATDEQKLLAAEAARKAHFARLALKSARSRAKGKSDAKTA